MGFTLIEMIVVLSIMVILTLVVLTGQSTFNQSLLLNDTAYTLALSIREAQSLGLSSRKFASTQNAGYGINMNSGTPIKYQIFADISPLAPGNAQGGVCPGHSQNSGPEARPGNCLYDSASELVQEYTFTRGFTIGNFCGIYNGSKICTANGLTTLSIVFERPNATTAITGIYNSAVVPLSCGEIHVTAPTGGVERIMKVTAAGQVAMNQACP